MKRLVIAGGGHAHVEVLRRFRARPPGVELVLVSPDEETPYSGMLPGHVAGFYSREEIFIRLAPLAAACGARFLRTRVTALAPDARQATLEDGTTLEYDLLSLDTGSTPATGQARGVRAHALAVKPIPEFLAGWARLLARIERGGVRRVAMVGGGAAGVEMLLAARHRVLAEAVGHPVEWHLLTDAAELLPAHPPRVRGIFERVFAERGVRVHRASAVASVEEGAVQTAGGLALPVDATLWATGAGAAPWVAASGLKVDRGGFAEVNASLQSSSHPEVFAAGDIASMAGTPRPKSGVYAVRQGPPLARNLRAALAGEPLVPYRPQRHALALITTGDRRAVATRGSLVLDGPWVWRWKDWIDRGFMARYRVGA